MEITEETEIAQYLEFCDIVAMLETQIVKLTPRIL